MKPNSGLLQLHTADEDGVNWWMTLGREYTWQSQHQTRKHTHL